MSSILLPTIPIWNPAGNIVTGGIAHVPCPPAQTEDVSRVSLMSVPFSGNFDDMSICVTNKLTSLSGNAKLLGDAIPVECESLEVTDVE